MVSQFTAECILVLPYLQHYTLSCSTAASVDEQLRCLRKVKVDHIVQEGHIQASGSKICHDQIAHLTTAERPAFKGDGSVTS